GLLAFVKCGPLLVIRNENAIDCNPFTRMPQRALIRDAD
ncbi:MAG: hypothetical protein ACI8QC_000157, partial [Planctomycetota bacterium]